MASKKELRNLILRGGAVSICVRTTGQGLAFLVQAALAQLLGVEAYGQYALLLSLILLLTTLSKLGLDHIVLKYASAYIDGEDQQQLLRMLRFSLKYTLLTSTLFSASFVIATAYLITEDSFVSPLLIASLFITVITLTQLGMISALLRAFHAIFYSQFFEQVLRPIIMLSGLAIAWYLGYKLTIDTTLFLMGISIFVPLSAATFIVRKRVLAMRTNKMESTQTGEWIRVAAPLFASGVTQQISTQLGILTLGVLGSSSEVAHFSAATKLAWFVTFGLVAMTAMASPLIASAWHDRDHGRLSHVATTTSRLAFGLSIIIALPILVFGQSILELFGPSFSVAYPVLVILVAGSLVNCVTAATGPLVTMSNLQKESLSTSVLALAVGVVTFPILIYFYADIGAAIASAITMCARSFSRVIVIAKRLLIDSSVLGLKFADTSSPQADIWGHR